MTAHIARRPEGETAYDASRPINRTLWIIGPDDAPTAIEYEQSDGKVYLLCQVSEADAMGLGYFVSHAARSMGVDVRQSLESRRDHS